MTKYHQTKMRKTIRPRRLSFHNEESSPKVIIKQGRANNKHNEHTKHPSNDPVTEIKSSQKKSRYSSSSSITSFDANDKNKKDIVDLNIVQDSPTSGKYNSMTSLDKPRVNIVTPSTSDLPLLTKRKDTPERVRGARRQLSIPPYLPSLIEESDDENQKTKFKLSPFGRRTSESTIAVQSNTRKVYSVVNQMTGSIGGNGNGGAIYGELTIGSMQKMVDLMKEYTNLNENSRFIDVGCGLGKPNLHVAQDPGVKFSYGVEMEHVRWLLGMCNLNQVFDAALKHKQRSNEIMDEDMIGHRCIFEHGNITDANYFDPFTHVYMFDIGFPPKLFDQLAMMFNRSQSPYLICYHGPKLMIDRYGFEIELLTQAATSMHGSSEGHTGYIYRRVKHKNSNRTKKKCPIIRINDAEGNNDSEDIPCDPMFENAWKYTRRNLERMSKDVKKTVISNLSSSRSKRNKIPSYR